MLLTLKVLRLCGIKVTLKLRVMHLKLLKLYAARIAETVTLMVVLMFVDVKGDDVRVQDVESWCCWLKVLRVWNMEIDVGEIDIESNASEVVETLCC